MFGGYLEWSCEINVFSFNLSKVFQHKTQVLLWFHKPKLSEQINIKQWKTEKLLCVIKE